MNIAKIETTPFSDSESNKFLKKEINKISKNFNLEITKLKKKTDILSLKTKEIDKSIKDLRKSVDKINKPEQRVSTRKLTLMDRLEADDRLKNLMIPDYKMN